MTSFRRSLPFVFAALLLLVPVVARATTAQFDLDAPSGGPFPSDIFTVADPSQNTGVRVSLPKPDCGARPSDCADIDVLNTLDGFNAQPRISIPFNGPIDPASVNSANVFLVSLGSTLGGSGGTVIGINQVVWDPATRTLHVESDEFLDQHTRYLLVVTHGVRAHGGKPVDAGQFNAFLHRNNLSQKQAAYRRALLDAFSRAAIPVDSVVAASIFTTQSATAVLEKIRDRIKAMTPAPTATVIASFTRANVVAIRWHRQVATSGPTSDSFLPVPALDVFPGAVGRIVFGHFQSPDWETPAKFIPAIGTRTGVPAVQGTNTVYFNLFVPSGTPPPGGWPVAIFGHGFTDSKQGAPFAVASAMAFNGIATIVINVVGHGGGPDGTLEIIPAIGTPVVIPDGGRGIDQDGNGTIDSTEGSSAAPPNEIISNRDGLRQTVADLIQLVRVIKSGIDVDGNGTSDLNGGRIYYVGQSFGGIYGTKFIAVEPDIRAGVPNVPGGAIIEIARLSPSFRPIVGFALLTRVPSLSNAGPFVPPLWGFQESIPLRDDPAITNPAPGAMPIQEVIDNTEWVSQSGNPVAYAPYLRKMRLEGVSTRPFIIQSAKGDQTVPNPTASAIVRAGDAHDRWTLFRNDLVLLDPTRPTAPANPHTFLTNIGNPSVADLAIAAQFQIAVFFATDGAVVIDPDTAAGPFFEVPISAGQIPLMEDLNF
jgi:hypothetical protein